MERIKQICKANFPNSGQSIRWLLVFCCLGAPLLAQPTVYWQEDWEGDWFTTWTVTAGTWEVGIPGSGPNGAYQGQKCAATILAGNYGPGVNSRLEMINPIMIPDAGQYPRLRYWHWFDIGGSDGGRAQIKIEPANWETISEVYIRSGGAIWSSPSIDLREYAGLPVKFAFQFSSDGSSTTVSSGWYVDSVTVFTGPPALNNPQTWENGPGDWYVTNGIWEVGTPLSGPNAAYEGEKCAATILNGNYVPNSDSRLVSPEFAVPDAAYLPALRFWHWYNMGGNDLGRVQIRPVGGDWQTILGPFQNNSGGVWFPVYADLTLFAGDTVQVCFYFFADGNTSTISSGWYVDSMAVDSMDPNGLGDMNPPPAPLQSFILQQNYPNPFNPSTAIAYFLPIAAPVRISVYNLLGMEIKQLADSYQPAGDHTIIWDGSDHSGRLVPGGIYFYRLESSGKTEAKRMILLR